MIINSITIKCIHNLLLETGTYNFSPLVGDELYNNNSTVSVEVYLAPVVILEYRPSEMPNEVCLVMCNTHYREPMLDIYNIVLLYE